jgi:hypothetical protein
VRIPVGIEHIDGISSDIDQALAETKNVATAQGQALGF